MVKSLCSESSLRAVVVLGLVQSAMVWFHSDENWCKNKWSWLSGWQNGTSWKQKLSTCINPHLSIQSSCMLCCLTHKGSQRQHIVRIIFFPISEERLNILISVTWVAKSLILLPSSGLTVMSHFSSTDSHIWMLPFTPVGKGNYFIACFKSKFNFSREGSNSVSRSFLFLCSKSVSPVR